jgi:hypothetical protein
MTGHFFTWNTLNAKIYHIPGVSEAVDQTHIYKFMLETINAPAAKTQGTSRK